MHFSASGVEVSPFIPPLVAFVISSFTSTGGVSGAILLLPFQMSVLGFTSPAVSATNQLFNVVAIPSGVARYIREGRMVWPLTWVVVAGTLPGVLIGALIRVRWLPDPAAFKVFAGAVLLYIGGRMAHDLVRGGGRHSSAQAAEERFQQTVRRERERPAAATDAAPAAIAIRSFSVRKISYEFHGEVFDIATPGIFALAFVVGDKELAYEIKLVCCDGFANSERYRYVIQPQADSAPDAKVADPAEDLDVAPNAVVSIDAKA
jgi:uncharacterized membrane protein YfcA